MSTLKTKCVLLLTMLLSITLFKSGVAQEDKSIKLTFVEQANTKALEFSPAYYNQGLVYVSSQYRHGGKDNNIDENYFDLLYADLGPRGKLSKPINFSPTINTKYHEGPVSFSSDMKSMFFCKNNQEKGKPVYDNNGVIQLEIYSAIKGSKDWQEITKLPFNSDSYSCMHPSVSKNSNRLYFASNMPGGFGKMDLYYVDWKNGKWTSPINLGPSINTADDEAFPFVHPAGKLFFASNKAGGFGGFDMYMVDVRKMPASKTTLLPKPLNSSFDDLGIIVGGQGLLAFFSSNRPGGKGKDDLYRANMPNGLQGLFPPVENFINVIVKNAKTREPINGANVNIHTIPQFTSMYSIDDIFDHTFINEEDDGLRVKYLMKKNIEFGKDTYSTDASGKSAIIARSNYDYLIVAGKNDFIPNYVEVVLEESDKEVEILLTPIEKVIPVVVEPEVKLEVGTIIVLDELYYDFDKSYIRTDASKGLDAMLSLMNKYPLMKVKLTSHTDSRGEKDYNQKLSQRRAFSAKYYMTSRGVDPSRIEEIGMGEDQPINQCVDGVKCTEEEHQMNRRTEIYISSLGAPDRIIYIQNKPEYIDIPKRRVKK